MKLKFYNFLVLVAVFALSTTALQAQKGKGYGTVEPYTITAQALKGPNDTEVTVKVSTANAATFPIPAVLKKLQLKIRNAAGDVVYIKNFQNTPVTGGNVVVSVAEPLLHNTLEVLAGVKTNATVDADMSKTKCQVLLRPDLTIPSVAAPTEQLINAPFEVEVVVKELNLESGATFNVTLLDGGSPVGTVNAAVVAAGAQVSVVFGSLTVATTGVRNYTAQISGVVPGDFNDANNSKDFSIKFIDPQPAVNAAYYGLEYYDNQWAYGYKYTRVYDGALLYEYLDSYRQEGLSYYTYTYNAGPNVAGAPVSADYKIESPNIATITGSVSGLTSYYNYGYGAYYYTYDPLTNISFYAWADNYGYVQSQIYRYQSEYVYYYNNYDGYQYSYSYKYGDAPYLSTSNELKVSLVTTIGDFSFGGGATMPIYNYSYYDYSYSQTYFDWYWNADVNYVYTNNYHYFYGYNWGITDPTMLPKAGKLENPSLLGTQPFGLDKVYQNGSQATIQFSLDREAPYILNVTDMQGREALRVVEGTQPAGLSTKQLDISNLSQGVYIIKLQSGNQMDTKKVMLKN